MKIFLKLLLFLLLVASAFAYYLYTEGAFETKPKAPKEVKPFEMKCEPGKCAVGKCMGGK